MKPVHRTARRGASSTERWLRDAARISVRAIEAAIWGPACK